MQPSAKADKVGEAYRALYASLSKLPNPSISLSEIKFVSPDNPIARDVLEILGRQPTSLPTRTRREKLGDMPIEEALVYPRPRNHSQQAGLLEKPKDLEELWTASPTNMTPNQFTVTFTKQPFMVTRAIPAGFDPQLSPVIEFATDYKLRDGHVVTTKVQVAMQHDVGFYGIVLKQWDESSDYVIIHCK